MPVFDQVITDLQNGFYRIDVYRIKKLRCHHKGGFKSVSGVRISSEILDADTMIKRGIKGLANSQNEVLP